MFDVLYTTNITHEKLIGTNVFGEKEYGDKVSVYGLKYTDTRILNRELTDFDNVVGCFYQMNILVETGDRLDGKIVKQKIENKFMGMEVIEYYAESGE